MLWLLAAATATACLNYFSTVSPLTESDPEADVPPPAQPVLIAVEVYRGKGWFCGPDGQSSYCAEYGHFRLRFETPDTTGQRPFYLLELVDGELPEGFGINTTTPLSMVRIDWDDGATFDQEPLDFTLRVTPVNVAGEEGPPLQVPVFHPGTFDSPAPCDGPGACSTAPTGSTWGIDLAVGLRRRR